MKSHRSLLFIFFFTFYYSSFSQKLKKADRTIAGNIQAHVNFLASERLNGRAAGSDGERIADEYVIRHFQKSGYQPVGDSSRWLQTFNIYDGKAIAPATRLQINGSDLKLYMDYFPLAFSANEKTASSVSMDLAEKGVPWFIDLKDLLDNQDSATGKDTFALIATKAGHAADKGATALFIYNHSLNGDLVYHQHGSLASAKIPVIYLTKAGSKKYLSKDPLDVNVAVDLADVNRTGNNIAAYADNKADSIVLISAHLDEERDVAALMELSRLLKSRAYKTWNYLFVVYCGEKKGVDGIKYFNEHPVINLQKVNYRIDLDTIGNKGLPAVKQSLVAINALRSHETKTRP